MIAFTWAIEREKRWEEGVGGVFLESRQLQASSTSVFNASWWAGSGDAFLRGRVVVVVKKGMKAKRV